MILKYKGKTLGGGSNAPVNATYLVNAPIGAIMVWSGTEDSVPQGWSICDGTNGTLDLRDKFVLGAGDSHAVGETGGTEEVTLTIAQMPKHQHYFNLMSAGSAGNNTVPLASGSGGSLAVNGSITKVTGDGQSHPNMPPYYTALYIQKTGPTPSDYATEERVQEIVEESLGDINAILDAINGEVV